MGKLKKGEKRVEITNLKMNDEIFYIKDPDMAGLPPGAFENKDCKVIIPAAESVTITVNEGDLPALKKRIAKIEGLRIDVVK